MKGIDFTGIAYLAAFALVGFVGWEIYSKAKAAIPNIPKALEPLNPTSANNLAYKAVNSVVQAATGTDDTLGTWLAGVFSPSVHAADAAVANPPANAGATTPGPAAAAAAASVAGMTSNFQTDPDMGLLIAP